MPHVMDEGDPVIQQRRGVGVIDHSHHVEAIIRVRVSAIVYLGLTRLGNRGTRCGLKYVGLYVLLLLYEKSKSNSYFSSDGGG